MSSRSGSAAPSPTPVEERRLLYVGITRDAPTSLPLVAARARIDAEPVPAELGVGWGRTAAPSTTPRGARPRSRSRRRRPAVRPPTRVARRRRAATDGVPGLRRLPRRDARVDRRGATGDRPRSPTSAGQSALPSSIGTPMRCSRSSRRAEPLSRRVSLSASRATSSAAASSGTAIDSHRSAASGAARSGRASIAVGRAVVELDLTSHRRTAGVGRGRCREHTLRRADQVRTPPPPHRGDRHAPRVWAKPRSAPGRHPTRARTTGGVERPAEQLQVVRDDEESARPDERPQPRRDIHRPVHPERDRAPNPTTASVTSTPSGIRVRSGLPLSSSRAWAATPIARKKAASVSSSHRTFTSGASDAPITT